jgi:ABC-type dipeptide/oligopeptide/nickel transport system permease component
MRFKAQILGTLVVIFGVSLAVFFLMHLAPGDPVKLLLPEGASTELIDQTRKEWGLDKAIPIQYWEFIKRGLRGDLGKSFKFGEPVTKLILERLPATLELAFISFLISILISIPVGVLSAARQNSFWDHASMISALMGSSLPHFWLGIMLIFLFGGMLKWLPVSGRIDYGLGMKGVSQLYLIDSLLAGNWAAFSNALKHIIMPAFTLGIALSAIVTRITRSSMVDVIRQDYMITARAKGLGEMVVLWKHGFRNALCTIITILGLQLGTLLAGSIIIETVFSWPGIGSLLIQAISFRDYKLVQGITLFFSIMYITINLVVDFLYTRVDPRVRI